MWGLLGGEGRGQPTRQAPSVPGREEGGPAGPGSRTREFGHLSIQLHVSWPATPDIVCSQSWALARAPHRLGVRRPWLDSWIPPSADPESLSLSPSPLAERGQTKQHPGSARGRMACRVPTAPSVPPAPTPGAVRSMWAGETGAWGHSLCCGWGVGGRQEPLRLCHLLFCLSSS